MSIIATNEETKKTVDETKVTKEEVKETAKTVETTKAACSQTKQAAPKDSLQAIGQVPLPGSGAGKGTVVKK